MPSLTFQTAVDAGGSPGAVGVVGVPVGGEAGMPAGSADAAAGAGGGGGGAGGGGVEPPHAANVRVSTERAV